MKKLLLLAMVAAGALMASAATPERAATRTNSGLKVVNRAGHAATLLSADAALKVKRLEAPDNAVEVPFTHGIGKDGLADIKTKYTIINANNDNRLWQIGAVNGYGACMVPNAADVDNNDDWLFTVPIHLTPGDYVVSFEVGMMGSGATAVEMNVTLGTEPTIEAATIEVTPTTQYTDKNLTKHEHGVTIAEEGYYYLGFHCTTAKTMKGTLKLANVGMSAGSVEPPVVVDPPAAGTLTYTLAPKGELKATVVYTAPTLTKSGKDLEAISKVEITSRWGVDKFTYEDVTPGQVITIEDVEMYEGINNRFTGVAYVGEVAGDMVEYKSIWCGPDTPLAPENVKLTVNPGFTTATLSWDAVAEVGEHGGYVDPEQVVYYIFDAFGTYYDPAIAETSQTSFTLDYSDIPYQDFYAYQVTAGFGERYSLDNTSDIVTAGTPDALPKRESFDGGVYQDMWLGNTAVKGSMNYGTITDEYFASLFDPEDPDAPKPLASQDGDGGFYFWMPYEKDVAYGLISTRADISKAANPVLEFWYQGQGSLIEVYAGREMGEMDKLATIDLKENSTSDWTQARLPLNDYKALGGVMFEIRFVAAHNDDEHIWSVPLDNICVRDLTDTDVRIVTFAVPGAANHGQSVNLTAHIENLGTAAAAPTAQWTINGETFATQELEEIAPNAFADATLAYTVPYDAPEEIEVALALLLDGDNTADNEAQGTIRVKRAPFATVNDLVATVDGSVVTLSWSHPVNEIPEPETVTEDFESADYTPMSITGAGEWTVYDGDGVKTYNLFRETYNPYQTSPMAFQLFDNVVAQVPSTYAPDAEAHSGQRFMAAPSAQSAYNDNWLISPQLSGNAQTVTFYAKSYTSAWAESLEVYYSTTDNTYEALQYQVEELTGLDDYYEVPEVWTEFTAKLPEGAKYFAIRHYCYDTYGLFIDDVTYEAAPLLPTDLELHGYHVYRNGEQLTEDLHPGIAYTDDLKASTRMAAPRASGNEYSYTVVPVYSHGVAPVSNVAKVYVDVTGIEDINSEDAAPAVWYNLQGVRIAEPANGGAYIRVNGNRAEKVMK